MNAIKSAATVAVVATALFLAGCWQITPESQREVGRHARVPGLAESLVAKDRAIKAAILMSWHADVEIQQNMSHLDADVQNGKVILTGTVPDEKMRKRCEDYARAEKGVVDVLNKIEVDPNLKDQQFSLDDT
jgi:osmotically-inducible protein OsmY